MQKAGDNIQEAFNKVKAIHDKQILSNARRSVAELYLLLCKATKKNCKSIIVMNEESDHFDNLLKLSILDLLNAFPEPAAYYGNIVALATFRQHSLSKLLAASFSKSNTRLVNSEVEVLSILRTNRQFIPLISPRFHKLIGPLLESQNEVLETKNDEPKAKKMKASEKSLIIE